MTRHGDRTPFPPRPVLDIRGLVVHRDGTLILDRLDRLDWRVQRGEQADVSALVPKSRGDILPA